MSINRINVERILERIDQLAACSLGKRGVTRLSFTPESRCASRMVERWMREAGMEVRTDPLGNVIGRYPGRKPGAPAFLIGSHLDSVVEGGKFDGALGVVTGIEVVQTLREQGIRPDLPLEVVAFCDEEGARFHTTLLGSRAMAGTLDDADFDAMDADGITLAEAMRTYGLEPLRHREAVREPGTVAGYLELHIEQGPILERENQACGIVRGIAGASRCRFRVEGRAGHAGTVPMDLRQDALNGAAEIVLAVERVAGQMPSVVATVGQLQVFPGSSNVIPGRVEGTLDVRSLDDEQRHTALRRICEEAVRISRRRRLLFACRTVMETAATPCAPRLIRAVEEVMASYGLSALRIPSGAGHDALAMAALTEVGMVFIRCRDGISHHPDEDVSPDDIRLGAAVLLDAVLKLTMETASDGRGGKPLKEAGVRRTT
ncbi:MAG: allantoate amidohydrolase [Kyrpidia sp.]|nr:allantoate amidohydrolase [Kyrpidia sp.]